MIKSIKSKLYALAAVITVLIPLTFSGITYAQSSPYNVQNATNSNACLGSTIQNGAASAGTACNAAQSNINILFTNILNIISWIVGSIAVLLIVIAGFRYIISGGESAGTASAKNSILYAIVGLVIVAFAQVIVQFVLHRTTGTTTTNY